MPAILRRPSFQDRASPPSPRASTVHMPAPVKGWNTKDPVAAMDPQAALVLDNWFPMEGEVKARLGWTPWNQIPSTSVMSLLSYSSVTRATRLFACCSDNKIYDVTTKGTVTLSQTTTWGDWYGVNFTNVAGTTFLWCANGVDGPRYFDGIGWSLSVISGPASSSKLIAPWLSSRRIWTIEDGTMNAWFLPLDSIAGAAKKMPLGALFNRGGYLMAGASWTVDGGDGVNDMCVFVTSEGEVAVYQGTNPESSTSWSLVGVFFIGKPPSRRCFTKFGGDLLVLTEFGVIPLSSAMKATDLEAGTMSDSIRPTIMDSMVDILRNNRFGAQLITYPAQNALVVNVPDGQEVLQYVMNTITGAWCSFSNWYTLSLRVFNGHLYGGMADGTVALLWDENAVGDGGTDFPVVCTVQTAFSPFGRLTTLKKLEQFRPHLLISLEMTLRWGFVSDYRVPQLTSQFDQPAFPASYWDVVMWDQSYWNVQAYRFMTWLTATSVEGYALGLVMEVMTLNDAVSWSGSDFLVETGGLL